LVDKTEPIEVVNLLRHRNVPLKVVHIESGDYVFGDVAIERKTISDFLTTVHTQIKEGNRLFNQLKILRDTYKLPFLLIEGPVYWDDPYLAGPISTLLLFMDYRILFSMDASETANMVAKLFFKYGVERASRPAPPKVVRALNPEKIRWGMVQCVPGIGPGAAKKIMDAAPSLFTCYNPPDLDRLKTIKGLNKEAVKLLIRTFTE
jgi:ERCC4-type nuclease